VGETGGDDEGEPALRAGWRVVDARSEPTTSQRALGVNRRGRAAESRASAAEPMPWTP
jgi:hypothetical protein